MIIARFAGTSRHDVRLAKRELARARCEIAAVTKVLDDVRTASLLLQGKASSRVLKLLDLSRRIGEELRSTSARLSRLN